MPVVPGVSTLRRLTRVPLTPTLPLPAKVKIRFLEPVAPDAISQARARGEGSAQQLGDEIRALIQENLFEMVAERQSVWLG